MPIRQLLLPTLAKHSETTSKGSWNQVHINHHQCTSHRQIYKSYHLPWSYLISSAHLFNPRNSCTLLLSAQMLVKPCQVLQFSTNFQWFKNEWLALVIGSIKIGKFQWYFCWSRWWLIYPLLDHLSWHMSLQNKSHSYTRCIHYIFLTVHSLSKMILFASDSKKNMSETGINHKESVYSYCFIIILHSHVHMLYNHLTLSHVLNKLSTPGKLPFSAKTLRNCSGNLGWWSHPPHRPRHRYLNGDPKWKVDKDGSPKMLFKRSVRANVGCSYIYIYLESLLLVVFCHFYASSLALQLVCRALFWHGVRSAFGPPFLAKALGQGSNVGLKITSDS